MCVCVSNFTPIVSLLLHPIISPWWSRAMAASPSNDAPSQTRPPKVACLVMCRWRLQGINQSKVMMMGVYVYIYIYIPSGNLT